MNGRTLYFTLTIMYDFLILFFMLRRISFHVSVLVYCQSYMFSFRCFYTIWMYVSVLLSTFWCLMAITKARVLMTLLNLDSLKRTKLWQCTAVFTVSFTVSVQCIFLVAGPRTPAGEPFIDGAVSEPLREFVPHSDDHMLELFHWRGRQRRCLKDITSRIIDCHSRRRMRRRDRDAEGIEGGAWGLGRGTGRDLSPPQPTRVSRGTS